MINMGEGIAWGSETALMDEAAAHIIAQREQIAALKERVKAARGALGDIFDGEPQRPDKPKKELRWCRKRAEEAYLSTYGEAP
jgi:hypothetical protein